MSYFCGLIFNNFVISTSFFMILISFFFFFLHNGISRAEHEENTYDLFESYGREELVKIAGYGEEKLSAVLITGSVHCEACLNQAQLHAWPVSGALVAVNCHINGKKGKSSWIKGVTDEFGDFAIDLPSNLHAIPNLDRKCLAKVLKVPQNSLCRPAYVRRNKGLRFSSVGNGIRTYDAGAIRFQHLTSRLTQGCGGKETNNAKLISQR